MALYVKEIGPADAPAIVFLHGGGASGWTWQPQIEAFADYHCLVPDLPEHGRSIGERPLSIQDSAKRIANLIRERVPAGKAHIIGLSLGAQILVQLLATDPAVVDHAIICGALVRPLPGASMVNLMARLYMPFRDITWLVKANMKQLGIPEHYLEEFRRDTHALTVDTFTRITKENMSFRLPPGLDRADPPALVVVGQLERAVMLASARDLIAALLNAEGYVVAGVGHNWNLEAPYLFNQMVRAWITGNPLPAGLIPLQKNK